MSAELSSPLRFRPLLKDRVWGGKRLAALGKDLAGEAPVGESWELVDLPGEQSVVSEGPFAGLELQQLVQRWRQDLMGPVGLDGGRFPLLVKYIDAAQTLSLQVHPDQAAAAELGGRPKSEAWYILDHAEGAKLYLGMRPGSSPEQLRKARGEELQQMVNVVEVERGLLHPVPPGTVHAIGAGVLLAEVQQPSDTTYRVYDWDRPGLDGKPRELHLEQALKSIHFEQQPPAPVAAGRVQMSHFTIDLLRGVPAEGRSLMGQGPAILVGLEGRCALEAKQDLQLELGTVVLLPHAARQQQVSLQQSEGSVLLVSF